MQEDASQNGAAPQPKRWLDITKLISISGPIAGLGFFLYNQGLYTLGVCLMVPAIIIVMLYLLSLVNISLSKGFQQVFSVLSNLVRVILRPFSSAGSNLEKLVYGLLLVFVVFYIFSAIGALAGFVITENERSANAYLKMADACLARDDYACALDQAGNAKKLRPDDVRVDEAMLRGRILKLAVDDQFFHDASPEEIENVDKTYEFLVNRRPSPSLFALKGIIFSLRDSPQAADIQFEKAIKADPKSANVHNYWGFEMAHWQIQRNWRERSQREFEAAINLDKKYATPLINLAMLVTMQEAPSPSENMFRQEEQFLLQANEADSNSQRVLMSLASLYTNWGLWLEQNGSKEEALKRYVKAQDQLERAYPINPKNPFLLARLGGLTLVMNGDPERAIQRFKDALVERPDYVEAQEGLGNALIKAGKYKEAHAVFGAALTNARHVESLLRTRTLRTISDDAKRQIEQWRRDENEIIQRLQIEVRQVDAPAHPNEH